MLIMTSCDKQLDNERKHSATQFMIPREPFNDMTPDPSISPLTVLRCIHPQINRWNTQRQFAFPRELLWTKSISQLTLKRIITKYMNKAYMANPPPSLRIRTPFHGLCINIFSLKRERFREYNVDILSEFKARKSKLTHKS